MKFFRILPFLLIFCSSIYAQEYSELEKKFIRGSIAEKIDIVTQAQGKDALSLSSRGLDYVIQNQKILGSAEDLAALAVSCELTVLKYPLLNELEAYEEKDLTDKIIKIFKLFEHENVKMTSIDCLTNFKNAQWNGTINIINDYLEMRFRENHPGNLLIGNMITNAGKIGDARSFSILYNIWINETWSEYKSVTENSLVLLAQNSADETAKLLFFSNNSIISNFLTLLKKSDKIDRNFLSNTAETALLLAINNAESLQEFSPVFVTIQLDTLRILSINKWAHACDVVLKNFDVAKNEHILGIITDEEFIEMMQYTANFGTTEISTKLSSLLTEYNGKAKDGQMPSEPVMLALIEILGEMGDKQAFDNLLYVTYLNYSDKIKSAAKKSLAALKW